MQNIKISVIAILAVTTVFFGCKKDIITDDQGEITNANVVINILPYVGSYLYNKDSVYFLGGANVAIDEVQVLHSGFYFINGEDTLPKGNPALYTLSKENKVGLGYLKPASYSGNYSFLVGLDSADNAKAPKDFSAGSPLADQGLYRGAGKGYNFITIIGRVEDPAKPGSKPSIPLKWVVATPELAVNYTGKFSFNVVSAKQVTFNVIFNLEELFTGLSPIATPIIQCDPANPNDYNLAKTLVDNFSKRAYLFQL